MNNINTFSNDDSPRNKIRFMLIIMESIRDVDFKDVGFVSCYHNTIPTRAFCPKCQQGKGHSRSKVFKNTKSLAFHLVKEHSKVDDQEYPTLKQSLKLVEIHSILLQMRMVQI